MFGMAFLELPLLHLSHHSHFLQINFFVRIFFIVIAPLFIILPIPLLIDMLHDPLILEGLNHCHLLLPILLLTPQRIPQHRHHLLLFLLLQHKLIDYDELVEHVHAQNDEETGVRWLDERQEPVVVGGGFYEAKGDEVAVQVLRDALGEDLVLVECDQVAEVDEDE
jgi:hypothetical protein